MSITAKFDNYPISLDTALQMVGSLKAKAINAKLVAQTDFEKEKIQKQIELYHSEELILYGKSTDEALNSLMDKIIRLYSPLLKELNEQNNTFLRNYR